MKMPPLIQLLVVGSVFIFMGIVPMAYSGIIFQENFDNMADWNTSGQYEGNECSVGYCASSMPVNWSFYRTVPGATGLSPVASVSRPPGNLPDHTTGTGKALIVRVESVGTVNWPGDGILGKYFGSSANYNELYIQFWIRTQSNWQSMAVSQSKVFRIFNWRGTENIFQWKAECSPIWFWDWAAYPTSSSAAYLTAYRCDSVPDDYYCVNSPNSYQKNDAYASWGAVPPTTKYADGKWNRIDFHVKMNNLGQSNGILEWSWNGTIVESHTNVVWKEAGSTSGKGWNGFALGGNSNNTWSSTPAEQWYAIDDVVVSTTPIATDSIPPQDQGSPNPVQGVRVVAPGN
jgi:hypothetical protein